MNNVQLAFGIDKDFIAHWGAVVLQILQNTTKPVGIHVLYDANKDRIEQEVKDVFAIAVSESANPLVVDSTIALYDVSDVKIEGLPFSKNLSQATYYRLYIPTILKDIDKILYLDSDILVRDNVEVLFNSDLEGHEIGACIDVREYERYCKKSELKNNDIDKLFNAGILLMNLKEMRRHLFNERVHAAISNGQTYQEDQSILNNIYRTNYEVIDSTWNYQDYNVWKKDYEPLIDNPSIVHFVGMPKPWKYGHYKVKNSTYLDEFMSYENNLKKVISEFYK